MRYAPTGSSSDFVDVCLLCQEIAVESGWIKEGSPTTPIVPAERKRRRKLGLGSLFDRRRPTPEQPVASEPILRRLSEHELAIVEAADLFNASAFRRTIAGIAKSLGEPKASVVPLSGVNPEVVITIAWDLSWYQYRVTLDSAQPVRLEERGHELARARGRLRRVERAPRGRRPPRPARGGGGVPDRAPPRSVSARTLGEAPGRDPARPRRRARRPALVPAPAPLRVHRLRRERLHRARGGRLAHR